MSDINTVSIKFKPGAYGVFRNLQNKYWYAIGEYVDNAVQSYEDNKSKILNVHGNDFQFEIKIDFDWELDLIRIADNAGGINSNNFLRAFEPASIPLDNTGLHEFGMGMKTASIWLSNIWTVRTAALDETEERTVEFDLAKVLSEEKEVLEVLTKSKDPKDHYTEITLKKLSKNAPNSFQISKLKSHLSSIYRKFIRSGQLRLIINGEPLYFNSPEVLNAPYYLDKESEEVYWKREINYNDGTYKAIGFIALLNEMSTTTHNGLALFRRGRVIEGSHDEKYTPKVLFGQIGSFRYKRLFGELELEGFEVSFNKGSFQEQGDIEALMEAIKLELTNAEPNILKQADEYRKPKPREETVNVAKELVSSLEKEEKNQTLNDKIDLSIKEIEDESITEANKNLSDQVKPLETLQEVIELKGQKYFLKLELINEASITYLYTLAVEENDAFSKKIIYKINLHHPFFERFDIFKTEDDYKPIILIIRALVIAELHSPAQGTKNAGNIRTNFNTFLRNI